MYLDMHNEKKRYVPVASLATMCGVSRVAVYKWLKEGKIPKPARVGTGRIASLWTDEQARRIVEWHKSKAGCA